MDKENIGLPYNDSSKRAEKLYQEIEKYIDFSKLTFDEKLVVLNNIRINYAVVLHKIEQLRDIKKAMSYYEQVDEDWIWEESSRISIEDLTNEISELIMPFQNDKSYKKAVWKPKSGDVIVWYPNNKKQKHRYKYIAKVNAIDYQLLDAEYILKVDMKDNSVVNYLESPTASYVLSACDELPTLRPAIEEEKVLVELLVKFQRTKNNKFKEDDIVIWYCDDEPEKIYLAQYYKGESDIEFRYKWYVTTDPDFIKIGEEHDMKEGVHFLHKNLRLTSKVETDWAYYLYGRIKTESYKLYNINELQTLYNSAFHNLPKQESGKFFIDYTVEVQNPRAGAKQPLQSYDNIQTIIEIENDENISKNLFQKVDSHFISLYPDNHLYKIIINNIVKLF